MTKSTLSSDIIVPLIKHFNFTLVEQKYFIYDLLKKLCGEIGYSAVG